jgi:hypothetical protein
MPFKKITQCLRGHALNLRAAHNPQEPTIICAPTKKTYHKGEATLFMTCPCAYKVCIACAEVGMYEEGGADSELGNTLVLVGANIVQDSKNDDVMKVLGLAKPQALDALSCVRNFYALAHAGGKSAALWRTCCDWRSLHAQLAKLDNLGLRALCVAEASKGATGRQLSNLIRSSLVERNGELSTPPLAVFAERLASAAAILYHQNDSEHSKAFAGLVTSAVGTASCMCTVA